MDGHRRATEMTDRITLPTVCIVIAYSRALMLEEQDDGTYTRIVFVVFMKPYHMESFFRDCNVLEAVIR